MDPSSLLLRNFAEDRLARAPAAGVVMVSRPVIALVTDRRCLAQRLELDPDGSQIAERLADLVASAAQAEIDLVQVRENDLLSLQLYLPCQPVNAAALPGVFQ